jgi:hypothetical protein
MKWRLIDHSDNDGCDQRGEDGLFNGNEKNRRIMMETGFSMHFTGSRETIKEDLFRDSFRIILFLKKPQYGAYTRFSLCWSKIRPHGSALKKPRGVRPNHKRKMKMQHKRVGDVWCIHAMKLCLRLK